MPEEKKQYTTRDLADSLVALATSLNLHPEVPLPNYCYVNIYDWTADDKTVAGLVRALGGGKKEYTNSDFKLTNQYGPLEVSLTTSRSTVCRKVVDGKRIIPAKVVPAKPEEIIPATPEQVIPESEEEVFHWECSPILGTTEAK